MDIALDNKSICQTTVQSCSCPGLKEAEVVWNHDFNIPLLHLRSHLVLSLYAANKSVLVGQVIIQVATLPRSDSGGDSNVSTDTNTDISQPTVHPLQKTAAEGREGHLSATAVVEVGQLWRIIEK